MTLDFVQLNAATRGLEGWPIPNIQQTLSRLGTIRHLSSLHQEPTQHSLGGLYHWTRVAMGLKGSGPYFQRSMANTVLTDLIFHICELYIDDVLIHGGDPTTFLANVRKVFSRLREFNVAVNPKKTKLGLEEVEYVGHVVSSTGTSFTPEKRLKVLNFPPPANNEGTVTVHWTHQLLPRSLPTHDVDVQASPQDDPRAQVQERRLPAMDSRAHCSL